MTLWQRWKQISLPNKLLVVASILMAFGTLFYTGVAIFQYQMMREQSETTKRQLIAMQEQSIVMQKSLESFRGQINSGVYLTMRDRYFPFGPSCQSTMKTSTLSVMIDTGTYSNGIGM